MDEEEKRPNTNTSVLVLIVFGSVIVFILSFSTACAWVLLAKWMITANVQDTKRPAIPRLAVCASVLTVVTIGLALAFAFSTRHFQTRVPLDTGAVLTNSNLDTRGPPVHASPAEQKQPTVSTTSMTTNT